jgi:hypothetical protein
MGVWLEAEETGHWFIHAVPKAVSHVLPSCSLRSCNAVYMKRTGLRVALCAVYLHIRKGYIDASNKHSTASRAPSPLNVFLPDYVRTRHSGLNDVTSTGHEKVWQADR